MIKIKVSIDWENVFRPFRRVAYANCKQHRLQLFNGIYEFVLYRYTNSKIKEINELCY